jgi:hypothetical protein
MANTLEINPEVYTILNESFGEENLKVKFDKILFSGLESLLKSYEDKIFIMEEKYG